jgi:hypothetical protein
MTIKHARTTYLEQAAALLPATFMIIKFTPAQAARIEKAAKICGWNAGESVLCARKLVLRGVAAILRA